MERAENPSEQREANAPWAIEELARRVFDENRMFIEVEQGMVNQALQHGLIPRKAGRDGYIRMKGSRGYHKDERTHAPDGSVVVHDDGSDSQLQTCEAMIHPPYGHVVEFRSEQERQYLVRTNLAKLASSREICGFCAIIYQGLHNRRTEWIDEWAMHTWADTYTDGKEIDQLSSDRPWLKRFQLEIDGQKDINEEILFVVLMFPENGSLLSVHLQLPPWPPLTRNRPVEHERSGPMNRTLIKLEFLASADAPSEWTSFRPCSLPNMALWNDEAVEQLRAWLSSCILSHPKCKDNIDSQMPKRLLEISQSSSSEHEWGVKFRLITTTGDCQFVALSHVWANSYPLCTTQETLDEYEKDIPLQKLSRCFRDAILMTLLLGFQYIWIDSLCIVQGDVADWEEEAPRMGRVYQRAILVMAAHGSDFGFRREELQPIFDPHRPDDTPVYCRESYESIHDVFFSEPKNPENWFGRSWCMQERLFARRILHFGGAREECVFECCTSITCECGHIAADRSEGNAAKTMKMKLSQRMSGEDLGTPDELWQLHIDICEDYSARGVTFATDTLPAISSIMNSLSAGLGKYFAGIWGYGLLLSLQWEVMKTEDSVRHDTYVAPSWSWASRTGAVMWYMQELKPSTAHDKYEFASIVDISYTLATADPYGKINAGHITLEGFTTTMEIHDLKMLKPDGRLQLTRAGVRPCYVTLDSVQDVESVEREKTVICLDIMRDKGEAPTRYVSALVLLEVELRGVYRRVGFSTMTEEHFRLAQRSIVTIV